MYQVKIESFEGPLDLLLHLIRRNQVNIYDIPIALITEQYLDYIRFMEALDLSVAGEFLVMAATLTYIKSRMLLPAAPDEDEEEDDPRAQLVQQLLEYKRYKDAAAELSRRELLGRDVFIRPEVGASIEEGALDVDLFHLIAALRDVLRRRDIKEFHEVTLERVTLMDRIRDLWDRIQTAEGAVDFVSLFGAHSSREEVVLTFLALLELIKSGMIRAYQHEVLGPVWIVRA